MSTPLSSKLPKTVKVSLRISVKFERILNALRADYNASKLQAALAVPYIVTCATALESILNDALLEHAYKKWGDAGKDYGEALLWMPFKGKLDSLPLLLTDHKYRFNKEHWVYQRLSTLIVVRNKLVHPRPIKGEYSVMQHTVTGPILAREYYEAADDLSIGSTKKYKPLEYHEAIEKLDKWFFHRLPDKLSRVAMLVANTK